MGHDEPTLGNGFEPSPPGEREDEAVVERLRRLVEREKYAVLATQGEEQPYASLVAFAFTEDLAAACFATPITTRKYHLLMQCERVALLVDSRSQGSRDMMGIEAFTATGRARPLDPGPEWERLSGLLIARHPQLEPFVRSPTSALFRVDICRYLHVSRFQEVRQWTPKPAG